MQKKNKFYKLKTYTSAKKILFPSADPSAFYDSMGRGWKKSKKSRKSRKCKKSKKNLKKSENPRNSGKNLHL